MLLAAVDHAVPFLHYYKSVELKTRRSCQISQNKLCHFAQTQKLAFT